MLPETAAASRLTFGPFTFDRGSRLLRRGEDLVSLPPRVVAVLELLLDRAGDVVPRQELIDNVWKDAFVTDTSLAEAVSFLRQSLGDDPQAPGYIQTVHRRGYRFIAPVTPQVSAGVVPTPPDASPAPAPRVEPSIARQLVPWSIATLSLAAAAVAVWHAATQQSAAPAIVRFEVNAAGGTRFDARAPAVAIAPTGSHLAWAGCDDQACRLYVRALDRLDAVALAGTDDAAAPFFSPDARWIAYYAGGKLRKIPIGGGTAVSLADSADALGGAWLPGGQIVFAGARLGLTVVSEDGGTARPLTTPRPEEGEVRHAWPSVSPDGTTLFFTVMTSPSGDSGGRVAVMRMTDAREPSAWKTILDGATRAQAAGAGAIVFARGAELAGIGFDPLQLGVFGTAQPIVTGFAPPATGRHFSTSATGSLVYVTTAIAAAVDQQWFAASALAPDASRVAAAVADGLRSDIWVASLENGTAARLTHDGVNGAPVWAGDGRAVYFAKRGTGAYELWRRDADAAAPASRVLAAATHVIPLATSSDAKTLLFSQTHATSGLDIWTMPAGGGTPRAIVQTPFDETAAALSPDGRFVAYQSNESGRWEVHAMRLEDGRRTVVSADGGTLPTWDAEGLRIRYRVGARTMIASLVTTGEFRALPATEATQRRRPEPVGMDAAGRVRFDEAIPPLRRGVVTLAFDRELRQLLGPRPGPMPR